MIQMQCCLLNNVSVLQYLVNETHKIQSLNFGYISVRNPYFGVYWWL